MGDIFDLEDVSDLPASLRERITKKNHDPFAMEIIDLLVRAGRPLNLDELTAGYYRLYKKERSRKQIMAKLYTMSKQQDAPVRSIKGKHGVYELTDKWRE